MKFCMPHWNALRDAITARGLTALVAESGEKAAANLASEINEGATLDNFAPLMGAHWAIISNGMDFIRNMGGDPLVMMAGDAPEWAQCPVCHLNRLCADHDSTCVNPECRWERGASYDWMIDRAADDQVDAWKALKP